MGQDIEFQLGRQDRRKPALHEAKARRNIGCIQGRFQVRFTVTLVGCASLVTLDPELVMSSALPDALQSILGLTGSPDGDDPEMQARGVRLPTIQVHGSGFCICTSSYWSNIASTVAPP
ncbi:hypothetical protein BDR22DRAFT_894854 [Usnea florida]